MSIDPSIASTVLSLVNSTVSSAKSAMDLAKASKDTSLKEKISEVFDGILVLQQKVLKLDEENRELQRKIQLREEIERRGQFGYWFKKGENDPLCPKCYEGEGKVIYLQPSEPWSGGIRRDCRVCNHTTWEVPIGQNSQRPQQSEGEYNPLTHGLRMK